MRHKFLLLVISALVLLIPSCSYSAEAPSFQVTSVTVSGNDHVVTDYILNAVNTKPGTILSRDVIQADVQAIYEQGFFSYADFDLKPEGGGVAVTFIVQENPVIESINFTGNTKYTTEQLMTEVFSQEGTVFNRQFFRNDLDRIQERYHQDGYVMARVSDV